MAEHKGGWEDQVDTTEANCLDPALTAAGCTDPMHAECFQQMLTLRRAIDDLSGKLDAWAVYSQVRLFEPAAATGDDRPPRTAFNRQQLVPASE